MQGIDQLNLGDTSDLDGPLSSSLFGSTFRASYLLYKGTWEGGHRADMPAALGRNLLPFPPSLKSPHFARWREDRESSVSCVLSARHACPRQRSVRFQDSTSFSDSQIRLYLLTSSQSCAIKQRSSLTWAHLPRCAPCCHSVEPEAWVAAWSLQSSVCKAASVMGIVFCQVGDVAP